jgi:hypothetical protein
MFATPIAVLSRGRRGSSGSQPLSSPFLPNSEADAVLRISTDEIKHLGDIESGYRDALIESV